MGEKKGPTLPQEIVFTRTQTIAYRDIAKRLREAQIAFATVQQENFDFFSETVGAAGLKVEDIQGKYNITDDGRLCKMALTDGQGATGQQPFRVVQGGKGEGEGEEKKEGAAPQKVEDDQDPLG